MLSIDPINTKSCGLSNPNADYQEFITRGNRSVVRIVETFRSDCTSLCEARLLVKVSNLCGKVGTGERADALVIVFEMAEKRPHAR